MPHHYICLPSPQHHTRLPAAHHRLSALDRAAYMHANTPAADSGQIAYQPAMPARNLLPTPAPWSRWSAPADASSISLLSLAMDLRRPHFVMFMATIDYMFVKRLAEPLVNTRGPTTFPMHRDVALS